MAENSQLNELEQSLINFLYSKKEIETMVPGGSRRVRSLMFNIKEVNTKACFTVQIGMMEAVFNTNTGLKEKGNIYGLERYIRDWFERPSVTMAIKQFVKANLERSK